MKQTTKRTANGRECTRMQSTAPIPAPGLKPCPFCGGAAVLTQNPASPPDVEHAYWTITCANDTQKAARSGRYCPGMPMAIHEDLNEVSKRWNTRAGERCAS